MRVLILMIAITMFSGCISRQVHEELTESRNYFKGEAKAVDSLRLVNNALYERNRNLEADLNKAERQLDQATVTNNALLRNYEEILTDYNRVVGNSGSVLATSAYEKQSLTERLAAQQAELDRKQREAVAMEYALQSRDDRLDAVQSYDQFGVKSGAATVQTQELNTLLENQRRQMAQLQQNLGRVLGPYGTAMAGVTLIDNRVQVSLQHSLLFTDGGIQATAQGMQALNQIASVLAAYTDVEVLVIGRGDSYGASDVNWEYGIQRASAVGRSLAASGVNPARILASGQGPGFSSSFGIRAVTNQTDIMLSPNMERVYQLLAR